MRCLIPISICLAGLLHAQVAPPQVGCVRYIDGTVRAVYGVPNSLLAGRSRANFIDAASFSDDAGLVASHGHISLLEPDGKEIGDVQSADLNPILNVDRGLTSAIAWLPDSQQLLWWSGTQFQQTAVTLPSAEKVTAVSSDGTNASLYLAGGNAISELRISLKNGNVLSQTLLSQAKEPVFVHQGLLLFEQDNEIRIAAADGSERHLPLPAPGLRIERMSANWLHLFSPMLNQHWALYLTGTEMKLSEIPGLPRAHAISAGLHPRSER